MKETPLSTNERDFLQGALASHHRIDARGMYDYRKVSITFGQQLGHAEVAIGKTKAMAQTSCEVVAPSPGRPAEGVIRYNVELSPMASPSFEAGRPSTKAVEIQRIVERGLKDSRAVETESLCIVAGEKVWSVRVDIHVLDSCGNIADAAALAALASIIHFRRPHVDVIGDDVTIHPMDMHVPDPLSVHHRPVCISFAFFGDGETMVVDPGLKEEAISVGFVTLALNSHKEVCAVHKLGGVALTTDQLLECNRVAHVKALELSTMLTAALKQDESAREGDAYKRGPSLREMNKRSKITHAAEGVSDSTVAELADGDDSESDAAAAAKPASLHAPGPKTAELFTGNASNWDDAAAK